MTEPTEALIISKRMMSIIAKTVEAKYEYMVTNGSKRIKKIIKRYEQGDENADDYNIGYNYHITAKLIMTVNVSPTEHKDWCEEWSDERHNHIREGEKCEKCWRASGYSLFSRFEYKGENKTVSLECFSMKSEYIRGADIHSNTWETFFEKLENNIWEGVEYRFCKCGDLCLKANGKTYDTCDNCFINSYKRTDEEGGDCCVCLQNDGCWTKLKCNHILHIHCWNKICRNRSECPLCRQFCGTGTANPYN